jgi:ketosteroid isomerase-like protein
LRRAPRAKLLLIGTGLLAAACRAPNAVAAQPDELLSVCRAQEAAWNEGDIEGFMSRGYWRSPELTFLSGGSWTRGYDPVLERYRARYATGDAEMGRLSFTDLEPQLLGPDVGLVRGRWALKFADGKETGGLFTLLMRRLPEGWRIVHDHTSVN